MRKQVWVFGLAQRKENNKGQKCYMQIVPDREAPTLLSIVFEKCLKGSIIYSDCWSSYNKISKLNEYQHQTVNHSYNFLDPDTGTCTNLIECLWNVSKQKFKEIKGCKRAYVQSYIDEFIWRYNNCVNNDRVLCYSLLLKELARFYSPGDEYVYFNLLYIFVYYIII